MTYDDCLTYLLSPILGGRGCCTIRRIAVSPHALAALLPLKHTKHVYEQTIDMDKEGKTAHSALTQPCQTV